MSHLTTPLHDLAVRLGGLWTEPSDRLLLTGALHDLDELHGLTRKIAREPEVEDVAVQMCERLAASFQPLALVRGKRILDIACGSNSSRAPANIRIPTPFGAFELRRARKGFAARFEPWMCRILHALGADAVGVDRGDLQGEAFEHHAVDLATIGALDFLPDASFDAIQDSRLFGSPEFASQFPRQADRQRIAAEVRDQERRLLKPGGVIIHSDAAARLG